MNTMLFKKLVNILTLLSFFSWNLAIAAPTGGTVAQGSAAITQSGTTTTITQASQNTVINWTGFNTASNEAVNFVQPNSSAIALNRINSGSPTTFAGSLSANGQVWILNPNGILFANGSTVNVAGLLVTTHNITDANFMGGNYQFTLAPGYLNSTVINNGTITVADTGMVALVAPGVQNNGVIVANLGKVTLATGTTYVLDLNGDQLINFGSSPAIERGYVSNSGRITAMGGKVYMTANVAAQAVNNVISMSGVIQATTARNGANGTIVLNGGSAGRVRVTGTLNTSGGAGYIETSGYDVDIGMNAVINPGQGGTWVMDPWNLVITACLAAEIEFVMDVEGSNFNLWAEHNLYVDSAITTSIFNGFNKLFLGAGHDVEIYAPITLGGENSLVLYAGHDIKIDAPLDIGGFFKAIARHDILINTDSITSNWSQTYDGNVLLEDSVNLTSNYGNIKFKDMVNNAFWTDPNDLVITVPYGKAEFYGAVGEWDPLNSLTVFGKTEFKDSAWEVVTVMGQYYLDTVKIFERFMKFETLENGSINFAAATGFGVYAPCAVLLLETGTDDGYTGGGIFGSVDVRYLILGGSGGSDLINSTVGGYTGADAWMRIHVEHDATGLYCVNGAQGGCSGISPTLENEVIDSQIFTLPQLGEWDLTAGGVITEVDLNGIPTDIYTTDVCTSSGCQTVSFVVNQEPLTP